MSKKKEPADEAQVDAEVRPEDEVTTSAVFVEPAPFEPPVKAAPNTEPKPPAEPAAEPKLATPTRWARSLGRVAKESALTINGQSRPERFDTAHSVADQIHGWTLHGQHTVEPLLITREAYEAALAAALAPVRGHYRPHEPALSPFRRRG